VNLASAQRTRLFCLRGLLEVIMTNLLQRGDDAEEAMLSTAKTTTRIGYDVKPKILGVTAVGA
jgi:hypothetical protein